MTPELELADWLEAEGSKDEHALKLRNAAKIIRNLQAGLEVERERYSNAAIRLQREREACAQVAESFRERTDGKSIAMAIRNRPPSTAT